MIDSKYEVTEEDRILIQKHKEAYLKKLENPDGDDKSGVKKTNW